MSANITGISKHLSQDGMNFNPHIPPPEYLLAGLQRPVKRWDENYIDFLILQRFPRSFALLYTLLRDRAIDELFGVWYFVVEIIELDAFVPAEIEVVLFLVV
jgi:hypothetical protein